MSRYIIDAEARQSYNDQAVRKASNNRLVSEQNKIIDADEVQATATQQRFRLFPGVIIA